MPATPATIITAPQTMLVRDDRNEWGEFFWCERAPVPRSDGGFRYTVTWTCYSSFGVFGHHWYDMGSPFAEFIQHRDDYYLLGKIAEKEFDTDACRESLLRDILRNRRSGNTTKEIARDGYNAAISILDGESDPKAWPHLLYEDADVSAAIRGDYCDITTQDYPMQAKMFVQKIWPRFVAALRDRLITEPLELLPS